MKHGRDFIISTLLAVFPYNLNSDEMDSNYCMMLQVCAHTHRKHRSKIKHMTWKQIKNTFIFTRTALTEVQRYWFKSFSFFAFDVCLMWNIQVCSKLYPHNIFIPCSYYLFICSLFLHTVLMVLVYTLHEVQELFINT